MVSGNTDQLGMVPFAVQTSRLAVTGVTDIDAETFGKGQIGVLQQHLNLSTAHQFLVRLTRYPAHRQGNNPAGCYASFCFR